ncbi:MAG: hypothetical protein QOH89_3365 [Pseudonocardiales bacterium]|nr:hypothetical protein [Pseudonocardiales bacterium]MDT4942785.1 hypothetical protein [Pseudonocardiales bacterium]
MTSHGDYSAEAKSAAEGKARAAGVFAENAETIVAALPAVPEGHVLIAVVDDAHEFSGTHHVANEDIVERVPQLEGTGWAMVFTPGTGPEEVRRRSAEMATLALRRAEMITRIRTRRT